MTLLLQTIIAGLFISLTGSLPLGNLNVTAMHISAHEGMRKAAWFALGVVVTEVIYLRITLAAVNWVIAHRIFFVWLQWLSVAFLLALAISSLLAARKKTTGQNVLIQNNLPRFLLGLLMSAVNPMQFPFWAGWAVALISAHRLVANDLAYHVFTLSAGAGTLTALVLFIYFGRRLSSWMQANQKRVQFSMGVLFLLLAVYQLVTIG